MFFHEPGEDMLPVICVCLSATFQYTIVFDELKMNEVNRTDVHFVSPSGKGVNAARILGSEGCPARVVTHLGGPRTEEFLSLCRRDGIDVVYAPTDVPIRTSTTLVDKKTGTSTELLEETYEVPQSLTDAVQNIFREEIRQCSAVVISGSRPSGYRDDVYSKMAEMASRQGLLTILDMKGRDLVACLESRPSIIKPNLQEFAETFLGNSSVLENEPNEELLPVVREKAADIYRRYGTKCVITRGRFDTWVYDGEDLQIVKNIDVPVINTIGCGDTLTACMTASLLRGSSLLDAVSHGMEKATERASHVELI